MVSITRLVELIVLNVGLSAGILSQVIVAVLYFIQTLD